jgi:hypothetical protein
MFRLTGSTIAHGLYEIPSVLTQFIVSLGGIQRYVDDSHTIVETRDGSLLQLQRNRYHKITATFGTEISQENTLDSVDHGWCYFWHLGRDNYQQDITIDCYSAVFNDQQIIVFRAQSAAPDLAEPLYLVIGQFMTLAGSSAFLFSASYDHADTTKRSPFPIPRNDSTNQRSRVHLPMASTPTQLERVYTGFNNRSASNGQCVLFPSITAQNFGSQSTFGGATPLTPFTVHVRDYSGEIYFIGTVPGLYFGATDLPDGVVISKADRHFRLCKSSTDDSTAHFFIEVLGNL